MLNLSSKEFDLNSLFSFDSLKEILLELAKSQIKLENSIKNIQKDNKERDKKILLLNKIIKSNDLLNVEVSPDNDENMDNEVDLDYNNYENDVMINEQGEKKENYEEIKNNENIKEFQYDSNNVNNFNDKGNQVSIQENTENNNEENKEENIEITNNKENIDKEKINQKDIISNNQQSFQSPKKKFNAHSKKKENQQDMTSIKQILQVI